MKTMSEHFNEEAKSHDNNFNNVMGMTEFYDEIERQIDKCENKENILVLGCGTGLEIERMKFKANVIAVDIAEEMLHELEKKQLFHEISLKTICGSFLELEFEEATFDIVLTCYAMHHFTEEQKLDLYGRIYKCLKKGGCLINGDSMVKTEEEESSCLRSADIIYREKNLPFGSLHIDIPFCFEHEKEVLKRVGFQEIMLEKEWTVTKLYRAMK